MNTPLLALGCILATYSLCAMEPQDKQPTAAQLIQTRAAEDTGLSDIRDRALLAAAQNGYLDPEALGPQFCQNFTTLTVKKFGISKDIRPCIQQSIQQKYGYGSHFVFSPCGRFYAFSQQNRILTRNIQTGLALKTTTSLGWPHTLIFSPDGSFLYAHYISLENLDQNGTVLQIDIAQKQEEVYSCERGGWFDFKKFNPHLILHKINKPIWHSKENYSAHFDEHEVSYPLALSPDGTLLVFKKRGTLLPTIIIWNLIDKRIVTTLKSHLDDSMEEVMFSDSGRLFIGITKDPDECKKRFAYIWDTKNWGLVRIIQISTAEEPRISISHDDNFLAICNEEGVNMYDIKTGKFIQTIAHASIPHGCLLRELGKYGPIRTLTFNHYGQFSTETYDQTMAVWDMIPLPARVAFRSLSINQLLVLMSLIKPLAAGRVIHLTPGSTAWNLVHTMPEEIKTLLDPCLKPVGIVTTITSAVRKRAMLIAASIFKKQ